MPEMKQYTREEVKNTSVKGKTLIILHDKVYDVTPFLNEHPGGEEILQDQSGRDGSDNFDDVGHSKDAMELMKKYVAGEIVVSERTNKTPKQGWTSFQKTKKPTKSESELSLYLYLAGIAIFVAIAFYLYV